MTSSFSSAYIWQHAGANRTRTSVLRERRISQALRERGIERSYLQHDVFCYECLRWIMQCWCSEEAVDAFYRLQQHDSCRIALALGFAPARRGDPIEVPADVPDNELGAAMVCCCLQIEPYLTYAELTVMLERAVAAVNERYHEEIVRSQLWNDMIPDRPPNTTLERMHDWLEKLGVIPAPETRHYAGSPQPQPFM